MEELIEDGKTGFVLESNIDALIGAMQKIDTIDRSQVRRPVEQKFSKERMTDEYEKLYYELCQNGAQK
ncbi:MAG: hypothetical protein A3A80_01555 [Candidatus Terrybacteria bacterium RIFCSPLOWO2_01_FULL_44_24]|uniref:Glycosyl transferase family 1 domain-containing protein n=1 Tax=Candidatus Terrybacteria bacterium RIFCSPHIGHO2_01_FULL_43_35 TaxID=1802361 RepID=A0A1G2PH70_9BACT|nr:MAG: hypothetical protein A2828_03930 [Candidatus Terrybacteria bacterium RIFCSPHIGHO2_01_FULL_43_35]OHA49915.1 MAG: hypothetical protein A3B75_03370 [Candidatus Terrybacteria bacterium RIFCSPHIGHO2_02_FULL_43_14]OHA51764.1 MAG: hypothetical protein A3A80_01555 [Candidatus Terrybacteria bacterium RIFCSPLOWO2_01_FULL_44_24]